MKANTFNDIQYYVNPVTKEVDAIYDHGVMGPLVRAQDQDGEGVWDIVTEEDSAIMLNYLNNYIIYENDDAKSFANGTRKASECDPYNDDDWPQHPMIEAFDRGRVVTEEELQKWCSLVQDENGRNHEAFTAAMERESKPAE